ncbi:hypothetical protein [Sulfurovum sp.]|uniref:hypothetical protein n=1 Tax=Sulfurovum sp. TaxID=1969726 RepID=UPI003566F9D1
MGVVLERIAMFNIILMEGTEEFDRKFFIDCPVDGVVKTAGFNPMGSQPCVRMQIPPALAKYISNLQNKVRDLGGDV